MGRVNTVDLLVLTRLDQLLLVLQTIFSFLQTSYLNAEVKRTSVSVSCNDGQYLIPLITALSIKDTYQNDTRHKH